MSFKERIFDFIRGEDPLVWQSLVVASGATIFFYLFIIYYTNR